MGKFTLLLFYLFMACYANPCISQKAAKNPNFAKGKDGGASADAFIKHLLLRYPEYFDSLLQNIGKWQISIIYTRIDRNIKNQPQFKDYYFNLDKDQYFYPASTVKMPTVMLALQKLKELKIKGLDKNTIMITDSAFSGQTAIYNDPESEDGMPTVANYIKKIFLVSDNNAFNRLYEFLGPDYINSHLYRLGFDSAQIIHRLNISLSETQNRCTNPVSFYDTSGRKLYQQPLTVSKMVYTPRHDFLGKAYYKGTQWIHEPFNFSRKNRIRLTELHNMLKRILFPSTVPLPKRFNLYPEDYNFVYRYMSMKPSESCFPKYDSTYPDAYSKLLLYGGKGKLDDGVRIFNKEGDAYGFLTDVAYIVDFNKGVEFLLSATIFCNSSETFNSDHYDYENVGYPFMKNLGRVFYEYECNRKRKRKPDLSNFNFSYDTRTH